MTTPAPTKMTLRHTRRNIARSLMTSTLMEKGQVTSAAGRRSTKMKTTTLTRRSTPMRMKTIAKREKKAPHLRSWRMTSRSSHRI